MATQYDPIAKDESLNTTEATPRNIADVLAEGLKGIEDALPTYTEGDGIDISAQKEISVDTNFTEASTRANIASGESFSTILGKIKKWFTDLKTVAFTGAYSDLTGKPTIPTDFVSKANGGTFNGAVFIDQQNGTASTPGHSQFVIGNSVPAGISGNSHGVLDIYGDGAYRSRILANNIPLTANRVLNVPNADGTIALTSDLTPVSLASAASDYGTIAVSDIKQMGNLVVGNIRMFVTQGANTFINVATVPINVVGQAHVPVTAIQGNYTVLPADLTGNAIRLYATSANPLTVGAVLQLHFTVFI